MEKNSNSGKSKSVSYPIGKRRLFDGKERAPRSLRKKFFFLIECSELDLKQAGIYGK